MQNTICSKMLFVLIGDDRSGKTTLQRLLIEKMCGEWYERLPVNRNLLITHPEIKRKYERASFANRSYQEKIEEYGSVDEYFENHFQDCPISFISSHLVIDDISEMIRNGKRRFFNVYGVFLSNSIQANREVNMDISELNWDERFFIENPLINDEHVFGQLNFISENFVDLIINRTSIS